MGDTWIVDTMCAAAVKPGSHTRTDLNDLGAHRPIFEPVGVPNAAE